MQKIIRNMILSFSVPVGQAGRPFRSEIQPSPQKGGEGHSSSHNQEKKQHITLVATHQDFNGKLREKKENRPPLEQLQRCVPLLRWLEKKKSRRQRPHFSFSFSGTHFVILSFLHAFVYFTGQLAEVRVPRVDKKRSSSRNHTQNRKEHRSKLRRRRCQRQMQEGQKSNSFALRWTVFFFLHVSTNSSRERHSFRLVFRSLESRKKRQEQLELRNHRCVYRFCLLSVFFLHSPFRASHDCDGY
jgi:hypothetical protein